MRLLWSLSALIVASSSVAAFAPASSNAVASRSTALCSAVAAADVKAKQDATFEKLAAKDQGASAISKDVSAFDVGSQIDVWRRVMIQTDSGGCWEDNESGVDIFRQPWRVTGVPFPEANTRLEQ